MNRHVDLRIIRFTLTRLLACHLQESAGHPFSSLRFDKKTGMLWRPMDLKAFRIYKATAANPLNALKTWGRMLFMAEKIPMALSSKTPVRGLIIFPRDSVMVTVAADKAVVAKVERKDANQKGVVQRECYAHEMIPEYVPSVIRADQDSRSDAYAYVVSKFAPNTRPETPEQWPSVLPGVLEVLIDLYQRAGVRTARLEDVLSRADRLCLDSRTDTKFSIAFKKVIRDVADLNLAFHKAALPQTFVHGDLTWDCIHRHNNSLKIIDWGNSGVRSILYDLFIQEFYASNPEFWQHLLSAKTHDFFTPFFYGAFPWFLDRLEKKTGVVFSVSDIQSGILLSLLDKSIDSYLRYRMTNELAGQSLLAICARIRDCLVSQRIFKRSNVTG